MYTLAVFPFYLPEVSTFIEFLKAFEGTGVKKIEGRNREEGNSQDKK